MGVHCVTGADTGGGGDACHRSFADTRAGANMAGITHEVTATLTVTVAVAAAATGVFDAVGVAPSTSGHGSYPSRTRGCGQSENRRGTDAGSAAHLLPSLVPLA
jgi:hypothetical protein